MKAASYAVISMLGPVQVNMIEHYRLPLLASITVPVKKVATISSNKGNVLELFLP